jgi:hypothetical protein
MLLDGGIIMQLNHEASMYCPLLDENLTSTWLFHDSSAHVYGCPPIHVCDNAEQKTHDYVLDENVEGLHLRSGSWLVTE